MSVSRGVDILISLDNLRTAPHCCHGNWQLALLPNASLSIRAMGKMQAREDAGFCGLLV